MKYLSFRILVLCFLLPTALYPISLDVVEGRLKHRYGAELEDVYLSNADELLKGAIRLRDAVSRNVDRYMESKALLSWGVTLQVTVTTEKGRLIYPAVFETERNPLLPADPVETAEENFRLMNEGLHMEIDLDVGHNTPIANCILAFYILVASATLYFYYRAGERRLRAAESEKSLEIERLRDLERERERKLARLDGEKAAMASELARLKENLARERDEASRNEDELLEDMISLEGRISENLELQAKQEKEIEALKERIDLFEKGRKKRKPSETTQKRFKALYKNLVVHPRAVDGFNDLREEMKIKCEEVIHQLNDDPSRVKIKRKVFGRKNRETVFEVLFAYRGRLYFRNTADNRAEVLAVGTKNSQSKELEFLDSL